MQKPSYTTSKRALWLSSAMAWLVILMLSAGAVLGSEQAVRLADIMVPYMIGLIVAILGIHRGFGSFDMWTITRQPQAPPGGQS